MRYFLIIFGLCVLVVMGILGKRGTHFRQPPLYIFPDMEWQLKLRPQKENTFFTNGISSQIAPAGTIDRRPPSPAPRGAVYPFDDSPGDTGRVPGTANI